MGTLGDIAKRAFAAGLQSLARDTEEALEEVANKAKEFESEVRRIKGVATTAKKEFIDFLTEEQDKP